MIVPEPSFSPTTDLFPEGTVDAGVYATHAEGFEHSLVILAMGEACWLVATDEVHHLRVEPAVADAARQQLAYFDRERIGWPPRPFVDILPAAKHAPLSPLIWVLGVLAVFWAQARWPGFTDAWMLDARQIFEHGEWWRVGSALWLHGDLGHLVANAGAGLLMFSAVVATFGGYAGWSLVAISALAGNTAAAALHHGEDYRSLGASTAIFAGLGLLAGRAVRVAGRADHARHRRTWLVPLAAGFAVLGLLGAGGENIDVLAHGTGFGAGLAAGFVAGGLKSGVSGKTG